MPGDQSQSGRLGAPRRRRAWAGDPETTGADDLFDILWEGWPRRSGLNFYSYAGKLT